MDKNNITLLETIFDGSASEASIIKLCEKIESNEIDQLELKEQLDINAHLFSALHNDKNGQSIFETICHTPSGNNLSGRIILKIDRNQKKSNLRHYFSIAAMFLIGLILWQFYENYQNDSVKTELHILDIHNQITKHPIVIDKTQSIGVHELGIIKNSRGSKISIAPRSSFSTDNKTFNLHQGKIFADIAHHNQGKPLQFHSNGADIKILGTTFLLQHAPQNDIGKTLLILKEGKVAFTLSGKTSVLTAGQFLLADHSTHKIISGNHNIPLESFGQSNDRNLIFQSPKKYKWIPLFWNSWTKDCLSINKKTHKLTIKTSPNQEVILRSKLFGHSPKSLRYKVFLAIPIKKGAIEVYLKSYRNGKINYSIANKVSIVNGELIVQQKKKGLDGKMTETSKKYNSPKGFNGISFEGHYNKKTATTKARNDQHTNFSLDQDMHFEISVIALDGFTGPVYIKNITLETF